MPKPTSFFYSQPPDSRFLAVAKGKTATYQCKLDPRASFCLYVPPSHPVTKLSEGGDIDFDQPDFPLVVLAHHSGLNSQGGRDDWSDWAAKNNVVILSILFPYEFRGGEIADNYKWLYDPVGPIKYDALLLDMVDTVGQEWGYVDTKRFSLAGYSGGGQFAYRFYYLHPERLRAVAVGAPGTATRLSEQPWPEGVKDTHELFGVTVTAKSLRDAGTKVQLALGELDTGGRDASVPLTRPQIIDAIASDLTEAGVQFDRVIVPGVGHHGLAETTVLQQEFIAKYLRS